MPAEKLLTSISKPGLILPSQMASMCFIVQPPRGPMIMAPMNIANLVLLAKKGYFDGRLVPRVVPDFVVQLGSPYDTMDGGPGYTVRCENSLNWYGPGSVGMALSGKDTGGSQFFVTLAPASTLRTKAFKSSCALLACG